MSNLTTSNFKQQLSALDNVRSYMTYPRFANVLRPLGFTDKRELSDLWEIWQKGIFMTVRSEKFTQQILDAGWGMFEQYITYKCEWYGKNKLQIPTFEASTKVCGECGAINHTLTLADREWTCANCQTHHHRDGNAARVIKKYCLTKKSPAASGGVPVELPTLVGALKQEGVH